MISTLTPGVSRTDDWPARRYFSECQAAIEHDLSAALNNDLKRMDADQPLHAHDPDWLLNLISIEEQCSYLLVGNAVSAEKVADLLNVNVDDHVGRLPTALLRKQILRAALLKRAR